jgi:gamma-D-glutamyl-L-lysine dipeptidyl-peptidase
MDVKMKKKNALLFVLLVLLVPIFLPGAPKVDSTKNAEEKNVNPTEIRRGIPMGGQDGKSRRQLYFERLIKKAEPSLKGDPEKLSVYLNLFENELINDTRLFATDLQATWDADKQQVVLSGWVNFEENKKSLLDLYTYLGFEKIEDQVEVLPSADLGEKKYAFVTAPHVLTFDKPIAPRETMNEGLFGDPVYLLKPAEDGYFLCAAADGYIAYIDGKSITRVTDEQFHEYQSGSSATLLKNFQIKNSTDLPFDLIPMGIRMKVKENNPDKATVTLQSPPGFEGGNIEIPRNILEIHDVGPDIRAERAIETAMSMLGSDYVWGGKTTDGVDCSGLVQTGFQGQGIYLARDASMQMYSGQLVATRWYRDGLQRGDLLYFLGSTGRVTHTAIYIGEGQFLEASKEVMISSLKPGDENYKENRDKGLAFARRLFQ